MILPPRKKIKVQESKKITVLYASFSPSQKRPTMKIGLLNYLSELDSRRAGSVRVQVRKVKDAKGELSAKSMPNCPIHKIPADPQLAR